MDSGQPLLGEPDGNGRKAGSAEFVRTLIDQATFMPAALASRSCPAVLQPSVFYIALGLPNFGAKLLQFAKKLSEFVAVQRSRHNRYSLCSYLLSRLRASRSRNA
ncbi:hypothetical protein BRAS3843_430025 [Bradyrhizobium sp. STM 3843]|nr:hypothetical protein BRAS3843_430025 [Bradyrhizobium sp. STM 3843]